MTANVFEDDVGGVLAATIRESDGDVYAVNLGRETLPDLVFRLHGIDDPPTVNLLVDWDEVTAAMDDFIVAGHAADLVAAGALGLRLLEDPPRVSLFVSEATVVSLVHAGDNVGGLTATEESFVRDLQERYAGQWDATEEYSLRTPPISDVRETLATHLGEGVLADFDAILAELSTVTGEGDELDEVTLVLLAAARHGEHLYEVSKWGEDVGLASKATFSRSKSELEDAGVVRTEKVPIDVGRPRLRLRLVDDLRGAEVPALLATTRERLAAGD
ncbi:MAG: DUF5821 family protein [Haloarculaceae archaeon]